MNISDFQHRSDSFLSVGTEFFLTDSLKLCQDGGEDQVDQTDFEIQKKRLVGTGNDSLGYHEHFRYGDVGCQRGILDHGDQGVGQRRKCGTHRLGEHDAENGL